ncbi:MAG: chorismate mutase [Acidimicrobiaceae bacterium]|nr:chorismate mutase [Acidimicrobiaceae bacterium]
MTNSLVRALRGATTVEHDDAEEIAKATRELLTSMVEANEIDVDDIISVLFTTSPDLTAAFPAAAARGIGFHTVPLMCASEIDVPGAKKLCIRIMLHTYSTRTRDEIRHVYLHDAQNLRDDLR